MTRVGLYGGSFNPIHNGHLIVAGAMGDQLKLDRVILLPSANPPHKQSESLLDSNHRAEMVRLAIQGVPLFSLSDHDLKGNGPSYTIDTVAHFRSELGEQVELYWMIGEDSLADLPLWRRAEDLVDACRMVTATRRGGEAVNWDGLAETFSPKQIEALRAGLLDTPVIEISSTEIRGLIAEGLPIDHLVPRSVADYIKLHHLYQAEL